MYMRKLLLINLLLMSVLLMQAQTYCGLHKYDGEHKNEVSGYMMGGSNVVSDAFFGFEGSYLRHLTDRWHVGGDMQIQFGKQLYSVDVKGGTWETPYFQLRIGESYIHYHLLHFGTTEPLTFTFGTSVNIRPRWNSWNIGLYFRNYDDFYYENWNINWGLNFYAGIAKDMQLFGQLNIRPAGSMSQLASRYETSCKLGIKYVW